MKVIEQHELKFEDLSIEQTIYNTPNGIWRDNIVMKNMGEYWEELPPNHPDFTKMIIKLHNHKHQ